MSTDLPQAVLAAATRLMGALALCEDSRDTVLDALADMYDAGRDSALPAATLDDLAALRETAADAINGERSRLAALHEIRATADRLADGINPPAGYGDNDGEQD